MVQNRQHLHTKPANLPNRQRSKNRKLPSRIRRTKKLRPPKRLPRPVWPSDLGTVELSERHMHEVSHQPHQPAVASQPHQCPRHHERTCNCAGGTCADDDTGIDSRDGVADNYAGNTEGRLRTPEPNESGNFRCPSNGLVCSSLSCGKWCEGGSIGAASDDDRRAATAAKHYRNIDTCTGVTK